MATPQLPITTSSKGTLTDTSADEQVPGAASAFDHVLSNTRKMQLKTLTSRKTPLNTIVANGRPVRNSSFLHKRYHRSLSFVARRLKRISRPVKPSVLTGIVPNSSFLHGKAPSVETPLPNSSFLYSSKAPAVAPQHSA